MRAPLHAMSRHTFGVEQRAVAPDAGHPLCSVFFERRRAVPCTLAFGASRFERKGVDQWQTRTWN